ncbi:L,D-transpeptidase family protein [Wohlfahrtiimonas chitiniclastica]|uniref:L,D-transpeptidase family protein n=1 Tax=Wohlfahrtiimonas chitiniclastica TaxID=400946 RepID=UPI001BCFB5A9|nr:murein L,D-transpeptidase family protein [Wohlfahrtiimonas chitiniclastica]MBS7836048.1 murein L,D-transpeptidase [Wohlfahrtiimonas chitiniclastica]
MKNILILCCVWIIAACSTPSRAPYMTDAPLEQRLKSIRAKKGDPIFVRIFKEERMLEIWYEKHGKYQQLTNYPICYYSGPLGPKKRQGDKVSPEGFYQVTRRALNPYSQYYKSFDLGFPNQYDRFKGYTGDYLMVHGDCVSVGCYAMTDQQMDEIYQLVAASLNRGQSSVPVHVFPFKMTDARLSREKHSPHYAFWLELKEGYDYFEKYHKVPNIGIRSGKYTINQ